MALQVWLPLNGSTIQQGVSGITMAGSPSSWGNGKIGKCASFNGSTSNVIYNNTTDFNYTDNFSWTIWVKTNYTGSTAQYIFTNGRADSGGYGYGLQCASTTNCRCRFGNSTYEITVNGGEWTHLAFTKKGNIVKTYKNGVLWSSYTFGGTLPTYSDGNGLGLGCFHYSYNIYPFYGDINDFRIYDHCLSPREVKEISKGLVLHYPLAMPGQENLLLNTATPVSWTTTYTNTDQWSAKDIYNMKSPVNQLFVANDTATFSFDWQFTPGSSGSIKGSFHLETGNVAPWILGSVSKSTGTRNNASNYIDLSATNTSGHVTCTFIVSSSAASADDTFRYFRIRWDKTPKDGTLKLSNCKLERGEIATPWIPNPADAEYSALGFDDGIEYDVSGYGNNGIRNGTFSWSGDTPRYNTSTVFNGTDNCIQFPFNDFCTNGDVFTMNIWWKKAALGSKSYETLIGGPSGFEMDTRAGGAQALSLYMASARGGNVYSPFNMNEWYMVTLVNDGTNELYYVNGVLVKTIEKKDMPSGNYYVGAWKNETGQNFNGFMSDFRFYKTALSSSDVLELYHTPESLSHNGTLLTQGEFVES